MDKNIKTIGLIVKNNEQTVVDNFQRLYRYLTDKAYTVLLDESVGILNTDAQLVNRETLGIKSQLVIVIGGDGTLLSAARSLSDFKTPILGINLGRLGFLVDVSPHDMLDIIDQVLAGNYKDERRFLLQARVEREGKELISSSAFNDVVVHIRDVARMIDFSTYIDDVFVNEQRADGLVISTPTGSTAYALSSGGPLIHPSLEAMMLVPICPHTLSNRPIVIGADCKVEVVINESNRSTPQISWDGQSNFDLQPGDKIIIQRKPNDVHLIHPQVYDYFQILRAKLRWSEQL
ncbi:MAG: NAD(+) kinase [Gammaproteobacteria bacterium]|nr:NAD(+) kinase [Gammaproteobacteria bacterium]